MNFKYWRQDLKSSIVVFLVALPLCLGVALASNAPLASGLIAGIVGGIVVGFLSGSSISVSGPAAGLTVIVATSIQELGSFELFTFAVCLSGILQIIFGTIRAGTLGNYFPTSVITGMLSAIGIILILKQFPHALGIDTDFMGDEAFVQPDGENTFSEIIRAISQFHLGAMLIAFATLLIILFWENQALKGKNFFKLIPGALVAVIGSVLINELFNWEFQDLAVGASHLVQLPFGGGISDFWHALRFPEWSMLANSKIYSVAITIAVVGSIESLLSVDAADKLHEGPKATSKNQELVAQGVGNFISGFIGGLPVTAVIVRTSANVVAGAKSKLSTILHGIWILFAIISVPFLMNLIPLSTLAVILILVGYKLTKPVLYKKMYNKGANQFVPFVITIIAILFTDLLVGIFIGMLVGFIFVIKSNMHKAIVLIHDQDLYLIRFYKDVSFLQKSALVKIFEQIEENTSVIIDGSNDVYIDDDIIDLIEEFCDRAKERNITVEMRKSRTAITPMFREV